MKTKYSVTDSKGRVHTRTSERTYTHAVVYDVPARPAQGTWMAREAYCKAAWCGRADLAAKELAVWTKHGWSAEVIKFTA